MMGKGISMGKFEVDPFDGNNNFSLWQSTIKDLLVQQGLPKAILEKDKQPTDMKKKDWEELEMKIMSTIRLSLAPEVKYKFLNEISAPDLWKKLEKIYISKSLTKKLFMKKQLYQLWMVEKTNIVDDLNQFNKIITQLSSVEVKIVDEDKAILLLASLSSTFDTLVTTLLVGKDTLRVDEVKLALLETKTLQRPGNRS